MFLMPFLKITTIDFWFVGARVMYHTKEQILG